MRYEQWSDLMERLGIKEGREIYSLLENKYAEKHRYYHTIEHINFCISHLENNKHLAKFPDEIELAIWFHDAIYNPLSSKNEKESAEMACEFLLRAGCDRAMSSRISDLIMATLHGTALTTSDQALIVDIDLSVLGCSPQSYKEFEMAVRKEYKKIPSFIFRRGRKKILTGFLDRERIYTFDEFYQKYEAQARINIKNAIDTL